MNAKSRILCLILAFFLFSSMIFSVGRSISSRSQEKRQASEKKASQISEAQVRAFLQAYYTFETVGDNYPAYVDSLSNKMKEKVKTEQGKKTYSPQRFGFSRWLKSEHYFKQTNKRMIEVLCLVDFTTSLLNEEGGVVKKDIRHREGVKLTYFYDTKNHRYVLDDLEQLSSFMDIQ
ncbi:hypothetical protein QJ527_00965 [Enterococcus mundtii]|uniref:hypothetical protein n=1 Tax=Enterococcus TaxID=1350 RepID=UPI0004514C66|nr:MULTISPECIES: hypothetical protein [Enterococcus]AZP93590.1 hypothetical protein CYK55_11130 [Enterococcus mundtii]EYT97046.1 hypothetical protein AK89_00690 [Enterococcus mundtii CRL35]MDK4210119.1 hypothetical protein [Enterococcus mundtii]MDO7878308.1 hypothetical protein [Enterococcus mundtii]MEC3941767.1 hypothetical protein [Enterococcus mundtii]